MLLAIDLENFNLICQEGSGACQHPNIDQTKVFEKTRFLRRHPGNILKRRDLKLFGPPRDTLKTKTANFQASTSSGKWFSR